MKKLTKNRNPNYTTSIGVSNNNRNKLIALANIYETTQKDLLSRLIDKEIEQLSFSDKNLFEQPGPLKLPGPLFPLFSEHTSLLYYVFHFCGRKPDLLK